MPVDKPVLDTRTFDQLVGEGRGQIPRLAERWTDHNASDPGITLLDLLAWLTEMAMYRLDRTPDESVRAFLGLLGEAPRPAGVASAVLAVARTAPGPALALPSGLQITGAAAGVTFETTRPFTVSSAQLVSLSTGPPGALADVTSALAGGDPFPAFGPAPGPGSALYLGFDAPLGAPGDRVSLFAATPTVPADADTWAAIVAEWRAGRRDQIQACRGVPHQAPSLREHHSARTVWEFHAGGDQWAPLPAVKDGTRALSLSGFVRFRAPAGHVPGPVPPGRFSIRCRLASGGFPCPPALRAVVVNAVPAVHAAAIAGEEAFEASRGRAQEGLTLAHVPVVAGSTRVRWTLGGNEDRTWRETATWDLVGPHDRRYVLEPLTGRIAFGNGRRGRVPTARWVPRVHYRVGGGPGGNAPAGTLTALADNPHNAALVGDVAAVQAQLVLAQPFAAIGGRPADDLVDVKARVMRVLEEPRKAVTLADFAWLARHVPGVPVGRAHALASYYPGLPCYPAPGCVTVVVVPDCPGPRPTPDAGFLGAVATHLERRRLVTTDVHVVAPCYDVVTVHAVLHVRAVADRAALVGAAQRALDAFFDPLRGGPDGGGWPIGRHVYRTEVLALLAALPGVERVTDVGLQGERDDTPRCGNLPLCPDCLPVSAAHRIEVRGEPRPPVIERSTPHDCP